ncbi:MAG: universal stress protein [Anaerolineae bacterium]|nr:universal stress protein [Anaerolineae bacterium]
MFSRILFAHDGGMLAERALVYLEHIARIETAEVIVLHVYQVPERYTATDGYETLRAQYEVVAQEIVDDAVELLRERGVTVQGLVLAGDSAQVILETAMREKIALIVMGTRGPSNITDVMLGDVSLEVLRHAHCPVLVVP